MRIACSVMSNWFAYTMFLPFLPFYLVISIINYNVVVNARRETGCSCNCCCGWMTKGFQTEMQVPLSQ